MNLQYETPPALTKEGWEYYSQCNCTHNKKYKYRHPNKPGIEVEWHVKRYQFKVFNRGMTMIGLKPIAQLDAVLKAL